MRKIKLTKEIADKIIKINGNVIGAVFKGYESFIKERYGEEGIKKVEKKLEEIGYQINFKKISSFRWYPEAKACITCLAMLDVFNLNKSSAFDIGYDAPTHSTLTKLLIKYFRNIETTVQHFPGYFKKHVDFAEMKCDEFYPEKRIAFWKIINFKKFHPIVYEYIRGYLTKITEMATKEGNVKVEQTKSLYNNDTYDEFKISW